MQKKFLVHEEISTAQPNYLLSRRYIQNTPV